MYMNRWLAFGIGVTVGVVTVSAVRSPLFKKACATLIGKGMQLKEDAAVFAESVKEDAQDIIAEAKYKKTVPAKG